MLPLTGCVVMFFGSISRKLSSSALSVVNVCGPNTPSTLSPCAAWNVATSGYPSLRTRSSDVAAARNAGGYRSWYRRVEHLMRYGEGLKQWYLSAIDDLAQQGQVSVCPIDGLSWCEIDDRADLEQAATVLSAWYADDKAASAG